MCVCVCECVCFFVVVFCCCCCCFWGVLIFETFLGGALWHNVYRGYIVFWGTIIYCSLACARGVGGLLIRGYLHLSGYVIHAERLGCATACVNYSATRSRRTTRLGITITRLITCSCSLTSVRRMTRSWSAPSRLHG